MYFLSPIGGGDSTVCRASCAVFYSDARAPGAVFHSDTKVRYFTDISISFKIHICQAGTNVLVVIIDHLNDFDFISIQNTEIVNSQVTRAPTQLSGATLP